MSTTTIRLHGALGQRFGREFRLAVHSPAEAVQALCHLVKGFREYLVEHDQPGFRVWVGTDKVGEKELAYPCGSQTIRIAPVMVAAGGDTLQIVGGVALIAAGGILQANGIEWGSYLTNMGVAMTLGGIAQALAPSPHAPLTPKETKTEPSYLFNGPVNTIAQGHRVPICYGRLRVGSAVISSGTSTETFARLGGSDGAGTLIGDGDGTPWALSVDPA